MPPLTRYVSRCRLEGEITDRSVVGVDQRATVFDRNCNPSRLVDRLVVAGLVRRAEAVHDRRHVELNLTQAGERLARKIAQIEEAMYQGIDAAGAGRDLDEIITYLRTLVADQPAGEALERRSGGDAQAHRAGADARMPRRVGTGNRAAASRRQGHPLGPLSTM